MHRHSISCNDACIDEQMTLPLFNLKARTMPRAQSDAIPYERHISKYLYEDKMLEQERETRKTEKNMSRVVQ